MSDGMQLGGESKGDKHSHGNVKMTSPFHFSNSCTGLYPQKD
ncbi:unnamed protein product [Chondrus crispus]|uniref:Uncharacterized protein n=1 Tax=Chondrus crispus TaxID=2769 RepID=R7QSM5_CHOCR|nr:unnamed protein product [Chondrus crispus]CDF40748.1 unnamed protein product [Chondrus crispus]|eukprot:XP_005711042.1 unnamed protein product [Chondrus crispus]